jgi:hypothetical protein
MGCQDFAAALTKTYWPTAAAVVEAVKLAKVPQKTG